MQIRRRLGRALVWKCERVALSSIKVAMNDKPHPLQYPT
jgi:hypothetical protein